MTLKEIQTKLKAVSEQLREKFNQKSRLNVDIQQLKEEEESLKKNLNKLVGNDIIISEHAILRYIERVYKIDVEAIKKEILPENTKRIIMGLAKMGDGANGEFLAGNHTLVVKNNIILTITL